MNKEQICVCDDCGSRNINIRFIPIIDKDIPIPERNSKFGSGKHNYKWHCIKAMQEMKKNESILIKNRSKSTIKDWFRCMARDIVRNERKQGVAPNWGEIRRLSRYFDKQMYRIESVKPNQQRVWKLI